MRFIRNHWYDIGIVPIAITIVCLILFWNDIDVLRRLALFNFIVILWHQFEEYRFPGGEPAITNLAMQPKDSKYPFSKEEFERGGYAEKIRNLNSNK